jgi:hypothetical protein
MKPQAVPSIDEDMGNNTDDEMDDCMGPEETMPVSWKLKADLTLEQVTTDDFKVN